MKRKLIVEQISEIYPNSKAQHFLKSAAARDFSEYDVANMTEYEAFQYFRTKRWGDRPDVQCPNCGIWSPHYEIKGQQRWRCRTKGCGKYFSVLYGTVFQERKLSYKKMLMMFVAFAAAANGVSFDYLSLMFSITTKTAQVFIGKIREVLIRERDETKLSGLIHIDGGHFGGRPRNGRVRRVDVEDIRNHVVDMLTKKKTKQPAKTAKANFARKMKKRRVIIVLRQVSPIPGLGAEKTIVHIADGENEQIAMSLAEKYIAPGSVIWSDENAAYNRFGANYEHETVEHSKEFATLEGVNNNQAESYFSRIRRHVLGVVHRIEPKYMEDIAVEMAWREDVRRLSMGQRVDDLLSKTFQAGRSRYWTGYWQGINRPGELIWSPVKDKLEVRAVQY